MLTQVKTQEEIRFSCKNLTVSSSPKDTSDLILIIMICKSEGTLKSILHGIYINRPDIVLRSNIKIKFRIKTTQLTKVQNSPYYRGVSLWDRLPVDVQRATTKVKFKDFLK